jgi:serine/threonine protein kinase
VTNEIPSADDPWIGQRLAGYTILRRIGVGGMGIVYLARHESLDRLAAIKFLTRHLTVEPAYVELFLREARAAAKMNHPNIVGVYDAGCVGDEVYYFIMEYVEGRDLGAVQNELGNIPVGEAVGYIRQAAAALGYAHKKNIIHRDVKPENLLLTKEGVIKVADLGLAKWIGDESTMTQSGWVLGSPHYISPERLRDAQTVDPRSDVYSLGATLYHLLTGRIPYEGSPPVVMSMHLHAPLPNPREANPNLDYDICDILQRMMSKDPADRYQNMEDVEKALAAYLDAPSHPDHLSPTEVCARPAPAGKPAQPLPEQRKLEPQQEEDEEEQDEEPAPADDSVKTLLTFAWRAAILAAVIIVGYWLVKRHTETLEHTRQIEDAPPAPAVAPFVPPPAAPGPESPLPPAAKEEAPVAPPADADTIFVSPKGGSDAPGTLNEPAALTAALWKVKPGQEIVMLPGTYHQAISLPRSGEQGKPIRLSGDGKAVIDLGNLRERSHGIVGRNVGWWVIEGIEVRGHLQGLKFKDCHDMVVRKCKFNNGGSGLDLEGNSAVRMLFEDVETSHNEQGGVDIAYPVSLEDVTFRRCISSHNRCKDGTDGFGASHGCKARNFRVEFCQSHHNGSDGFDIDCVGDVTVDGCIAHHNGGGEWGGNFKTWQAGTKLINCVAWATGPAADANFEVKGEGVVLLNCTSGQNEDSGIVVAGENIRIINCIIADSKKFAIKMKRDKNSKASCNVENTMVHACGSPGGVTFGKGRNSNANPKFVDAGSGDYRIRKDSPAVGKGQPQPGVLHDADGKERPPVPSIGAYEPGP